MTVLSAIGMLRHSNNQFPIGTAFLIHDSGLLASCFHVVAALGPQPQGQRLEFQPLGTATPITAIVTNMLDPQHDLALLQLTMPIKAAPLRLIRSTAIVPGTPFQLSGYGETPAEPERFGFLSAHGSIVGRLELDGVVMLQLSSKEILPGMSGGPVFVPGCNGVAGVLSGRYTIDPRRETRMGELAWAGFVDHLLPLEPILMLHDCIAAQEPSGLSSGRTTITIAEHKGDILTDQASKTEYHYYGTTSRPE
ncbi:MAG: trypsin-like peptidase domain-containing protein, partial [Blastochloris sp.]|nr:trypsin-like peptidase domain-containing protein [Blastochloris sp.]